VTDSDGKKMLKQSLSLVAVGIEMGISVVIGILGGQWLDVRFGTEPVFFWVGVAVGFGAAAKAVVDAAIKVRKELNDNEPEDTHKN
jgi:F0F1-type ATP synthase assembly protein I